MHTATLRDDGTIIVAGGYGSDSDEVRDSLEIVDPSEQTAQEVAMSDARAEHAAVLLEDGQTVWIIGGHDANQALDSTDVVSGTESSSGPSLNRSRFGASAISLGSSGNNLIAVIGGFSGMSSGATASYELGNPLSSDSMLMEGNWNIGEARGGASILQLPQSRDLLVIGGFDPDRNPLDSVERVDIRGDQLPPLAGTTVDGTMFQPREAFAAAPVSNGRILLVGGKDGTSTERNDAEYFNPYDPVR